ncbi:HNH endonuclease [Heliorestis convoluta]|uniref:HNH endonuclease n=1 Tax=Heliorestis convoluta TaxID=356322 RepID=A0A5Q2N2W7_9FIRM|nr:HNH endonuclease [Heliorestis convoluta]QGG47632.1 HNH endonuclease [Heliorestis convoluta]
MSEKRNPAWQRDELILALDLYMRTNPLQISASHREVIDLSEILNRLPIHGIRPDATKFRNSNGVYMKLCNFLRFDPSYQGTGLQRGGKLEEEIWKEFFQKPELLRKVASAIRNSINETTNTVIYEDEDEFPEGKVLFRQHKYRERNRALVRKAKARAMREYGRLQCTVCDFDFHETYGDLGEGYIECHHTVPVSEYVGEVRTKVQDVVLVCSNCHRMLHKRRPWLTIMQLKDVLKV